MFSKIVYQIALPDFPLQCFFTSQMEVIVQQMDSTFVLLPAINKGPSGKTSFKDLLTDKLWKVLLGSEFDEKYFQELEKKLEEEYKAGKEIFPPKEVIFNALNLTPLDKVCHGQLGVSFYLI